MATLRQIDSTSAEKDGVKIGKDAAGQLLITAGGGVVTLDADDVALLAALVAA